MVANNEITANVFRYNPESDPSPSFATYRVPLEDRQTVMTLLETIYRTIDPTLAFRAFNCNQGVCASCRLKVNGRNVRACSYLVKPGDAVTVEPIDPRLVIRDLVVALDEA